MTTTRVLKKCPECKGLTLLQAADLGLTNCVGLVINGDDADCQPNGAIEKSTS